MKEIKLIAQPNDVVYYLDDAGLISIGKVLHIKIWGNVPIEYSVGSLPVVGESAFPRNGRIIIGNTVDELLQNLKNEYLQRTSSSQPITT